MNDRDNFDDLENETCEICGDNLQACLCDECGMMPDGQCTLAGTEFCDWDCPRN